jgi:hypothetical protein
MWPAGSGVESGMARFSRIELNDAWTKTNCLTVPLVKTKPEKL